MKNKTIAFILFAISSNAFAIFCPTNFSSIDYGYTIDQVVAVCGEPNSQNTFTQANITTQEWEYYIRTNPFSQITEKLRILISGDRVANINVPGPQICETTQIGGHTKNICRESSRRVNVISTTLCGQIINVGDNSQTVEMACGQPIILNQQQNLQNPDTQITEFQYNGPPPVTLIFEGGILKARK